MIATRCCNTISASGHAAKEDIPQHPRGRHRPASRCETSTTGMNHSSTRQCIKYPQVTDEYPLIFTLSIKRNRQKAALPGPFLPSTSYSIYVFCTMKLFNAISVIALASGVLAAPAIDDDMASPTVVSVITNALASLRGVVDTSQSNIGESSASRSKPRIEKVVSG